MSLLDRFKKDKPGDGFSYAGTKATKVKPRHVTRTSNKGSATVRRDEKGRFVSKDGKGKK